jgi:hypothetical protein
MIVARLVKEFLIILVILSIVLRGCHLKVGNPCKFTVDVSLLSSKGRPGRHSSTSNSIFLIWVKRFLWFVRDQCLLLMRLIKVLLISNELEMRVSMITL